MSIQNMNPKLFYVWFFVFLSFSCSHTSSEKSLSEKKEKKVFNISTNEPTPIVDSKQWTNSNEISPEDEVIVLKSMLYISENQKDHVELREGPGAFYPIKDRLLDKGEMLIVTDRVNVWRKVIAILDHSKGWVHEKVLSELKDNTDNIKLFVNDLPSVNTVKPITSIMSFIDNKPISASIPKGMSLYYLKKNSKKILVWFKELNTVGWIARGSAK